MAKNANWAKARTLCPPEEYGSQDWVEHYATNPDTLTQMLGDLYRVYKSEEEKRNGTANPSGGRRRSHINGNMDELWEIITPRFSMQPFHLAFEELKGKRSLRAFAMKCGIDFRELSRMVQSSAGTLKGRQRPVTRYDLEVIAKAGGVHPAYFVEWRLLVVQALIADVFAAQPNLSISLLRGLRPQVTG
jgi:hypothetical protein